MARRKKTALAAPNTDLKYGLKYSLLLHGLLLLLLLEVPHCGGGSGGGAKPQNKGGAEEQQQIKEKQAKEEPKDIQVDIVKVPKKAEPTPKPKPKHADVQCDQFYGGIGIYEVIDKHNRIIVSKAVPGYPGAEAGLEMGDVILAPGQEEIKGEVGTEVTLQVQKYSTGDILTIKVVRDKICVESGNPNQP